MTARLLRFPTPAADAPAEPAEDSPYTGPAPAIDPYATAYTVTEAAYLINVATELVRQWAADGTIPAIRVGDDWQIPRTRFTDWIDNLPIAEI